MIAVMAHEIKVVGGRGEHVEMRGRDLRGIYPNEYTENE